MTRATVAGLAFATVLLVLALAVGYRLLNSDFQPTAATPFTITPSTTPGAVGAHPGAKTDEGFLYGRVTTVDGETYEGRLRWNGDEEAFWGDYFNGVKDENRWAAYLRPERPPEGHGSIKILGIEFGNREPRIELGRPFMARFGDIVRIEGSLGEVRVTIKSGTVFVLDRFEAGDFDDGVRVWDGKRGVIDLDSRRIRAIELLPTPSPGTAPYRLHGSVRTRQGEFSGFVQWNREECAGTDWLDGRSAGGRLRVRFDTIRSISRRSRDSSLVTLLDGREIVLSDSREVGRGNRGIYVDDRRYGRVLISWDAFERADFDSGGSGPAYGDFPPGRPLTGTVTNRAGKRFTGRLVYDLDESETTETLDAPFQGVDYTIPFGLIASIIPAAHGERDAQRARVTLHGGGDLRLERAGDLGAGNAGILVFVDGDEHPAYLPWPEVEKIDFDRPATTHPPLGGH